MDHSIMRNCTHPDFIVIGAMKSATTTLHEQLARQPRLFMSRPKEPNYFSDDENYARGPGWYASLYTEVADDQLAGESSTHYTKLPTYPHTVRRMVEALPRVKLIYVMRHPLARLASHYLHEVTVGRITIGIEQAIERYPELVDYGRYSMQLEPYLRAYGPEAILPVFFDRLVGEPQEQLDRLGRFLGLAESLRWDHTLKPRNVGRERLRRSRFRDLLVRTPGLSTLRRACVSRSLAERVKSLWQIGVDPPMIPPALEPRLRDIYDQDLRRLGSWLGLELNCEFFEKAPRSPSFVRSAPAIRQDLPVCT
jgi:hypothetical protein